MSRLGRYQKEKSALEDGLLLCPGTMAQEIGSGLTHYGSIHLDGQGSIEQHSVAEKVKRIAQRRD